MGISFNPFTGNLDITGSGGGGGPITITDTYVVNSEAEMLALTVERGDVAVRTDLSKTFILKGNDPTLLADWQELLTPPDLIQSVNGQVGTVVLDTDDVSEGTTNQYFTETRARDAAVSDSITDGITNVAPSQNAVYDALALKYDASNPDGFVDAAGAAAAAPVQSVNTQTGDVVLDTDDVAEGTVNLYYTTTRFDNDFGTKTTDNLDEGTTNLYFTDTRAKTAAVSDSITDGVTDVAPSQNAVYDALALKYDASNPSNFVDAAGAKAAAVSDSITDGVTDVAPSQNAVYDALALKYDASNPAGYITAAEVPAATWGGITGTLSSQTDLQTALDGKFDDPTGTTAQYIRGDGSLATFPSVISDATRLITYAFNETGTTIPKFSVVYINGGHSESDQPTIALAQANNETNSTKTYGITQDDISHMSSGRIVVSGALTGVNTDQFNPTAPLGNVNGVALWLSPTTPGGVTTTKPSAPNHMVYVGTIVRTHQNQGVVEVKIQNGYELEELHNVAISSPNLNHVLLYNNATSVWENKAPNTALNALLPSQTSQTGKVLQTDGTNTSWQSVSTTSAGDINETLFNAANNQSVAANVTGLAFANATVRSFKVLLSVVIDADSDLFEAFELLGVQNSSGWSMTVSSVGDTSGIVFSITSSGQVQYTSLNKTGWVSTKMKFRANVTTI